MVVVDEGDVQEDDAGLEGKVDDVPVLAHLVSLGGTGGHGGDDGGGERGEASLGDVAAAEASRVVLGGGERDGLGRLGDGSNAGGLRLNAKALEGGTAGGGRARCGGRGGDGSHGGDVRDRGHL